jgi:hypothetical protein
MKPAGPMSELAALGFTLPTPAYLTGLLVFGIVGWIAYRRGRKTERANLKWVGLAVMLYPYAVPQTWLLWTIGAAATIWIYFNWN